MLKSVKTDLEDVCDAMEHLLAQIPRMTREEKVDVAARLRAVVKTAAVIDTLIKDEIKKHLKNKSGIVKGEVFKAVLSYSDVTRLNQTKLKAEDFAIWTKYTESNPQGTITFEPR